MKKFLRISIRFLMLLPAIAIQVLYYFLVFSWLKDFSFAIKTILIFYEVFAIIYIINKRSESNYKILWVIIILLFPFIGTYTYLIAGNNKTAKPIEKRIAKNKQPLNLESLTLPNNSSQNTTLNFMHNLSNMPITECENAKFYSLGEHMYSDMLNALKQAKHFIFIEYFIIENGKFWDSIVDILKQKVTEGVCVKVLYDDIGSIATYSFKSRRKLKSAGIDIISFNPVVGMHFSLNNRDHRKMMIIDNHTCFSGGINIADEYINEKARFGHWKDIGFKITGKSVLSYTHLFCLFWNAYSKNKLNENNLYKPKYELVFTNSKILTYYDSPGSADSLSNNYFIHILSTAKSYVYFYTPYLILNDSLKNAFIQASQRNIIIKIFIPGIPDKKMPYHLSIKYAEELSKYGVKIYKYKKGFIHAKALLSDDKICSIGTVNLDYRSLFLHYENNSIFDDKNMINELKNDFAETEKDCELMKYKKRNIFIRLYKAILNIFSPLL